MGSLTNNFKRFLYCQSGLFVFRNADLITVLIEAPLTWWYSSDLKTSIPYLVGTVVFKW
ncbi:hypothetical protein GGR27_003701 [Lewinella antarctica]|uniref:Uncharacterized protein n=1 Tax=Neolewinella antarctica TaxID=442734 RepID=A0ABX0XFT0_9BACT|nr:hypothetical protein [Neolewinella antarctica]